MAAGSLTRTRCGGSGGGCRIGGVALAAGGLAANPAKGSQVLAKHDTDGDGDVVDALQFGGAWRRAALSVPDEPDLASSASSMSSAITNESLKRLGTELQAHRPDERRQRPD
jgi:hypothetical protein